MTHCGVTRRTTGVGKKAHCGDVESSNGALKRWVEQGLLLPGSRDRPSIEAEEQVNRSVPEPFGVRAEGSIDDQPGDGRHEASQCWSVAEHFDSPVYHLSA